MRVSHGLEDKLVGKVVEAAGNNENLIFGAVGKALEGLSSTRLVKHLWTVLPKKAQRAIRRRKDEALQRALRKAEIARLVEEQAKLYSLSPEGDVLPPIQFQS